MEIILRESLRGLIKRGFSLIKILKKVVTSRTFEFMWPAKGVHRQIIRRWVKKGAVYYAHWIWQIIPFLLLSFKWIGKFYLPQFFSNHSRAKHAQGIGKPECKIKTKAWVKCPTKTSGYQAQGEKNATKLDHKDIKSIHLFRRNLGCHKISLGGLVRVLKSFVGKKPPIPEQSRQNMGHDKQEEVPGRNQNHKANPYGSDNPFIAIKLYPLLGPISHGIRDRGRGIIRHFTHPFIPYLNTRYPR